MSFKEELLYLNPQKMSTENAMNIPAFQMGAAVSYRVSGFAPAEYLGGRVS
jgi:hypothetical protein